MGKLAPKAARTEMTWDCRLSLQIEQGLASHVLIWETIQGRLSLGTHGSLILFASS